MIGNGPSLSGVKTRTFKGPATVSRVLSSTAATSTTAPVIVGVHRARNEVRTSSMGNSHCGARAFASLASISFSSAGCSGILGQSSHADTLTVKAESGSAILVEYSEYSFKRPHQRPGGESLLKAPSKAFKAAELVLVPPWPLGICGRSKPLSAMLLEI